MANYPVALQALKSGARIARSGWNGKKMFVVLMEGSAPAATPVQESDVGDLINGVRADLFQTGDEGSTIRMPSLALKATDGSLVVGWVASQVDQLAEDWVIVE